MEIKLANYWFTQCLKHSFRNRPIRIVKAQNSAINRARISTSSVYDHFAFIIAHFVAFSFVKYNNFLVNTGRNYQASYGEGNPFGHSNSLTKPSIWQTSSYRLLSLESEINIKLCPPQPYDPLVKEFTVPRLNGYSLAL